MWKKKLREYKGRNYNYSLRKKLKREKKTSDDFEVMLHNLTIEEILGLKLELAASHINNKLYNFPIYRSIRYIVKEACLHFALSSTRSFGDAASFLGMREGDLKKEVDSFKKKLTKHNVEVLRPNNIDDCNQIFARDLGFVISNMFFLSNIIPNRQDEIEGIKIQPKD